jgi:hypothetical protein
VVLALAQMEQVGRAYKYWCALIFEWQTSAATPVHYLQ